MYWNVSRLGTQLFFSFLAMHLYRITVIQISGSFHNNIKHLNHVISHMCETINSYSVYKALRKYYKIFKLYFISTLLSVIV